MDDCLKLVLKLPYHGSVILASIMLKLGSYGLLIVNDTTYIYISILISRLIYSRQNHHKITESTMFIRITTFFKINVISWIQNYYYYFSLNINLQTNK